MGSKPFTQSIDWSAALMDSLRWLAIAWAIGAVCLLGAEAACGDDQLARAGDTRAGDALQPLIDVGVKA